MRAVTKVEEHAGVVIAARHCQPKEQLQPDMAKKRHQALDRCHGSGYWLLQAPSLWELLMEELLASQRQSWHSPRQFLYRSGTVTYGLLYLPARRARRCSLPCTVSMPWTMPLKAAGGNSAGIQHCYSCLREALGNGVEDAGCHLLADMS